MNIKAIIKRNQLKELAGEFFQDGNCMIVKKLNQQHKKALLGISQKDGAFTIIGENLIYYRTESGQEGEITPEKFLHILASNAYRLGKSELFEFVNIPDGDAIWVMNGPTMCAIWNTLLLMNRK